MEPVVAQNPAFVHLAQLALLLVGARLLGEVANRLNQPAVVGEILAGIVLGPSVLGAVLSILPGDLTPPVPTRFLDLFSLIGAMFLLLLTGLETDLTLIRRHARTALGVSLGGLIPPFASGFLLGQALPDWLLADPTERTLFSLFLATAMSISAIPVIAKVLLDLGLMRRDIGQTILAAGMTDDASGWILLSLIAGLAAGTAITAGSVVLAVCKVLVFVFLSFTAGRWLVKRSLELVQDEIKSRERILTLVIVFTFAWGAITDALHIEAVLGAFVMGILFGQMPRLPEEVRNKLESITLGLFAPLFFANAGLKVNLTRLFDVNLAGLAIVVIAVATAGKVVGTYAGARLIGRRDHWTALAFGAALNARGAMEIIVATIGLSLGILNQDMFSIIVLMAMVTSLMAPPGLRWCLRRITPEEAEMRRLRMEELTADSRVAKIHRVLVPIRYRPGVLPPTQMAAAQLLALLGARNRLAVTLLTAAPPEFRSQATTFLTSVAEIFPQGELTRKVVDGANPPELILAEARKDYDLLILGAPEESIGGDTLFTSLIDYLVRVAPCLTLVVMVPHGQSSDWHPRRILVPTNGALAANTAAEFAFSIAGKDSRVLLLNVVAEAELGQDPSGRGHAQLMQTGRQLVDSLCNFAAALGVAAAGEVRSGSSPETVILDTAQTAANDLIVLGTAVRVGSTRLFLGPRVERILKNATCPVVVVNTP